jgi:hypothetical protein
MLHWEHAFQNARLMPSYRELDSNDLTILPMGIFSGLTLLETM